MNHQPGLRTAVHKQFSIVVVTVVLGLSGVAVSLVVDPIAPAGASTTPVWSVTPTPDAAGIGLSSVSCSSTTSCKAVGFSYNSGTAQFHTVIEGRHRARGGDPTDGVGKVGEPEGPVGARGDVIRMVDTRVAVVRHGAD